MRNETNLSLEFWRSLTDQRSVVYQTVFRCVMLRLQGPKQRLLGTQNLYRTRGMFGQTEQTAGVTNQSSTDEVSNQGGQVWCYCRHSISKVLGELCSVSGDRDDLVTEGVNVIDIGVRYFCTHGYFGGGFDGSFEVFGENRSEVGSGSIRSEAHSFDDFGVR